MAIRRKKHLRKCTSALLIILRRRAHRRLELLKEMRYNQRRWWVKPWLMNHDNLGAHNTLLKELQSEDTEAYKNYLRMDKSSFDYILEKVAPFIRKENTRMRSSIPASERLGITLRFLATDMITCYKFASVVVKDAGHILLISIGAAVKERLILSALCFLYTFLCMYWGGPGVCMCVCVCVCGGGGGRGYCGGGGGGIVRADIG